MKRIETLTPNDRLAVVRTLNDAALNGDASYISDFPKKSFNGWLNWLVDEVEKPAIRTDYRVLLTELINHYHIVRPDGVNIYAVGQPLPLLPRDYERNSALAITDIFASRYGAVCILVEDMYTSETWLYSDIL